MKITAAAIATLLFVSASGFATSVYRSVDAKGIITYSDKPIAGNSGTEAIKLSEKSISRVQMKNEPIAATISPIVNKRHLAAQQLKQAYQELHFAQNQLKEKVQTVQKAQTKFNGMAPTLDKGSDIQKAKLDLAKQEFESAKSRLSLAQDRLAHAEQIFRTTP